jgi:hypothetical protein
MLPQQPPFFFPETNERFQARLREAEERSEALLREAELFDQKAAQLESQQATKVQQERNRRDAERARGQAEHLRGQAERLMSFEGRQQLIASLQQEEWQRIVSDGTKLSVWGPFRVPEGRYWYGRSVFSFDGRLFVCMWRQNEIWERRTHKKRFAGMDGHTYEEDVTEPVFTGDFEPAVINSMTEDLAGLTDEELDKIEPRP